MATYSVTIQAHSEQEQLRLSENADRYRNYFGHLTNLTDGGNVLKVLGPACWTVIVRTSIFVCFVKGSAPYGTRNWTATCPVIFSLAKGKTVLHHNGTAAP